MGVDTSLVKKKLLIVAPRTHPNLRYFCHEFISSGLYEVSLLVTKCSKDFVAPADLAVFCHECGSDESLVQNQFDVAIFRTYPNSLMSLVDLVCNSKTVKIQYDQSPKSMGIIAPIGLLYLGYRLLLNRPAYRITPHGKSVKESRLMRRIGESHFRHPAPIPSLDKRHSEANPPILGTVGKRFVRRKRIDLLVRVLRELSFRGELRIYMSDNKWTNRQEPGKKELAYDQKLQNLMEKPGFKIKVCYNRTQEAMIEEMSKLDLFVLPSINEAFSTSQLEALSRGVPAILTRSNGARGTVIESVTGHIVARSPQALRAKLSHLLNTPNAIFELKSSTSEYVKGGGLSSNLVDVVNNLVEKERK